MNFPVKRVENRTENHTRKQKNGNGWQRAKVWNRWQRSKVLNRWQRVNKQLRRRLRKSHSETDDTDTDKNLRLTSNTCKYLQ